MNIDISRVPLRRILFEGFLVFLSILCMIGVIAVKTELLYKAHYTNDHQDFVIVFNQLKSSSYGKVLWSWISNELKFRYQPIFYIEHVSMIKLLGLNWHNLYLGRIIQWSAAFGLLYVFARTLRMNMIYSLVFCSIVLIGDQGGQILSNVCTSGPIPIILYTICLIFTVLCAEKKNWRLSVVYSIVLTSCTLIEIEAYLVVMPILLILFCALYADRCCGGSLKAAFSDNWKMLIAPSLTFLIIASYILFFAPFNVFGGNYGAGVERDFIKLVRTVYSSFMGIGNIVYIFIIDTILLSCLILKKKKLLLALAYLFSMFFFAFLELLIHSKKGMWGRYKLPYMILIATVICIISVELFKTSKWRIALSCIYVGLVILAQSVTVKDFYSTVVSQVDYRVEYENMVTKITEMTKKDDKIVVMATDDPAPTYSMSVQVALGESNYDNVYILDKDMIVDFYDKDKRVGEGGFDFSDYTPSPDVRELYEIENYYPQEVSIITWDDVDDIIISKDFLNDMPAVFDVDINVFENFDIIDLIDYNNLVLLRRK